MQRGLATGPILQFASVANEDCLAGQHGSDNIISLLTINSGTEKPRGLFTFLFWPYLSPCRYMQRGIATGFIFQFSIYSLGACCVRYFRTEKKKLQSIICIYILYKGSFHEVATCPYLSPCRCMQRDLATGLILQFPICSLRGCLCRALLNRNQGTLVMMQIRHRSLFDETLSFSCKFPPGLISCRASTSNVTRPRFRPYLASCQGGRLCPACIAWQRQLNQTKIILLLRYNSGTEKCPKHM